tara:strand:+ start:39 stop:719 length:681 start_codon:yes stop_codon:yes gene_type:complete
MGIFTINGLSTDYINWSSPTNILDINEKYNQRAVYIGGPQNTTDSGDIVCLMPNKDPRYVASWARISNIPNGTFTPIVVDAIGPTQPEGTRKVGYLAANADLVAVVQNSATTAQGTSAVSYVEDTYSNVVAEVKDNDGKKIDVVKLEIIVNSSNTITDIDIEEDTDFFVKGVNATGGADVITIPANTLSSSHDAIEITDIASSMMSNPGSKSNIGHTTASSIVLYK